MSADKKWINLAYVVGAALLGWVLTYAFALVVKYAHFSNPRLLNIFSLSSVLAFFVAFLFVYLYTRQPKVQNYSLEVMQEAHKVTWPGRKVAYGSSVVVLVMVVVMAAILFCFDWICTHFVGWVVRA